MVSLLFPKQLSEFQFFIRSITLGVFVISFCFLFPAIDRGNELAFLYGFLGMLLVLKGYHVLFVIGPRFKDIGLAPGYAAFALLPFVGLVIFFGCCFAPAGWWQHATGPKPPPLPREPGEKFRDEY